jgi:hypothetical protein
MIEMSTTFGSSDRLGRTGIENILRLFKDGMPSGEIARTIGIEEWAIKLIVLLEGV